MAKGFSTTRSLAVQATSAEEAEQLATQQAKKNGWKAIGTRFRLSKRNPPNIARVMRSPSPKELEEIREAEEFFGPAPEATGGTVLPAEATGEPIGQARTVEIGDVGGAETGGIQQPPLGEAQSSQELGKVWEGRTSEPKILKRALEKLGVDATVD
jgi:hypothetical protein